MSEIALRVVFLRVYHISWLHRCKTLSCGSVDLPLNILKFHWVVSKKVNWKDELCSLATCAC